MADDPDWPDYTNAVFGNDLLFDMITQYLDIPDMKVLRQTCKLLLSKVNLDRKFNSNLQLTISNETINENGVGESIDWSNVKILVSRTFSHHFQNIITDSIEDLQLLHPANPQSGENEHSRSACYVLLEVKPFPYLRSLTIDLNLMCYDIPTSALACVAGTIKEFRLWGVASCTLNNIATAETNLKMIAKLPWKLESFGVELSLSPQSIAIAVGGIPASSASTLEELKICSVEFKSTKIRGVRFPRLKRIACHLMDGYSGDVGVHLEEFLRLQPPQLEAIELNCKELYGHFDPSILGAIRSICTSKLHTFRLLGSVWLESFPQLESWGFIRDLTGLKDFVICGVNSWSTEEVAVTILNSLPATTQSLEVHNVNCVMRVAHPETMAAITGFPYLAQLNISQCKGLMDDVMLQIICMNLTKLRALRFGSRVLTDFGLTGRQGNFNSGISIRNLKGLRDLDITDCGHITEDGLGLAIQFPELRILKLATHIPDPTFVTIASNNPSLESIYRHFEVPTLLDVHDYDRQLFSKILAVNPRLTRIHTKKEQEEGRRIQHDCAPVTCRPSYGVSTTLSSEATLSHVRNTMTMAKTLKGEMFLNQHSHTYFYNMTN